MTLAAGSRLGPYEILAPLGAGGMGEVYRARDSRLQRDVAIKVLPAGLTSDSDRLRRFEQEARASGAINHPNILATYDIGSHEGAPYLVSELLEGETLRERLGGAALPPRKALEFAVQVARGLAAAHERGIVHRDLKPENLFLTRDGHVKILDFGLAKLIQPEEAEPAGMTNLPTTPVQTEPGKILGTASYMSPEQVRGRATDHRSDLFTFGAILYEMLSGRRAFRRETAVETMNAILKEEPPDLSETNRNLPPALERIVRHCLEKRPEDRFQSARDLAFDLEAVSAVSGVTQAAAVPHPRASRRRLISILAGGAGLVLAAAGAYLAGLRAGGASASLPSFQRLTFRRGFLTSAAFGPDGRSVFYAARWDGQPSQIFSTRPESPESGTLGVQDAELQAISRSGEMAVLLHHRISIGWMSQGTLARVPMAGGAPREIAEGIQSADWSPDGKELALVRRTSTVDRLEYPQGKVLFETPGWISHVRISPGGNRFALAFHPQLGDDGGSVMMIDRDGRQTTLTERWASLYGLAWSRDGKEIWFTAARTGLNRVLYAVNPAGHLRTLAQIPGILTLHDVSADGRALVSVMNARREILGLRRGEAKERNLSWLEWSYASGFSQDGESLLITEMGEGGGPHMGLYLRKMDGSPAVRLGDGMGLGLSHDGKWALSLTQTSPARFMLIPTGAGTSRTIDTEGVSAQFSGGWLPGDRGFLFLGSLPGHGIQIFVQDLAGGKPRPISPGAGQNVYSNIVSPDGKYVATQQPDGRLVLLPLSGGEPRILGEGSPMDSPIYWSSDGRTLFVQVLGELPARVDRIDVATGKRERWKDLLPADSSGVLDIGPIYLSADGQSYIYGFRRALSDLYLVTGLK